MTNLRTLTAICALALGLGAPVAAQDAGTVVATVNGTDITLGHMIAYRASLGEQVDTMPAAQLYDAILDQMISMTVLADGREVDATGQIFLDNERRALLARDAVNEMSDTEVSDEEIQAAYDEMFGEFEGTEEFNASHILVETEEEAQALIDQLNGDADFAELAKEHSTGPSGPSGGELGWFGPGQMVPEFDTAVQEMDVNAIAGPLQTQFGWHVIKLNDTRTTEAPSVDEIRDRLAQEVQNTRITAAIEAKRTEAEVTMPENPVDPEALNDPTILQP